MIIFTSQFIHVHPIIRVSNAFVLGGLLLSYSKSWPKMVC